MNNKTEVISGFDPEAERIYEVGRKLGVRVVLAKSDMSGLKNARPETKAFVQRTNRITNAHCEGE